MVLSISIHRGKYCLIMSNEKAKSPSSVEVDSSAGSDIEQRAKKGPLSFLSGALTSFVFAWVAFLLSEKVVIYFTIHTPHYSSAFAQSIGSAFKTLIIGMSFLATFTFAFIGIGLTIVFIRSLFDANGIQGD